MQLVVMNSSCHTVASLVEGKQDVNPLMAKVAYHDQKESMEEGGFSLTLKHKVAFSLNPVQAFDSADGWGPN
eukprot:15053763-Alexandrium_andersonii.AAC.1